jgi:outer membrane protein OmpA-like peptidoglycan-associated protein
MGRQRWYARVQGRDILFKERNSFEFGHDLAVTASVQYLFGGKPHDSDLDEVRDWLDTCPDTPIGAKVDAAGCPTDSDRDSVDDGIDKCPDTPVGCKVDKNGCSIDADGDGVCDGLDQCPNTPKGAKVDAHGCPLDSDGDGVFDGLDQCESTAKGCSVDEKGCPQDEDGDGVCDALDKCPGTPAGAQVDAQGCETDASKLEGDLLDTGQLRVTGVTFQPGTANPTAGMSKLDPVGEVFTKWPELRVEIGVHTDPEGKTTPAALTKETQARADAVRAYLLQKYPQLKADQLVAKGYGTSRPLASNASEAGRTLNRRIEFTVLNKNVIVQSGGKRRLGTKP